LKRQRLEALVLPIVATVVLLVDQISKYLVATRLAVGQSWDIAPWLAPIFHITHVTNTGAAFGMFPQLGNVFVIVAIIVVVIIIAYYRHIESGQWWMRIAFGLALGGAIGNLADRLRQGFVVDFIDTNFWPFKDFPLFNMADASITVGSALLAVLMLWEESRERARRRAAESG
jgi:signal peptidase II